MPGETAPALPCGSLYRKLSHAVRAFPLELDADGGSEVSPRSDDWEVPPPLHMRSAAPTAKDLYVLHSWLEVRREGFPGLTENAFRPHFRIQSNGQDACVMSVVCSVACVPVIPVEHVQLRRHAPLVMLGCSPLPLPYLTDTRPRAELHTWQPGRQHHAPVPVPIRRADGGLCTVHAVSPPPRQGGAGAAQCGADMFLGGGVLGQVRWRAGSWRRHRIGWEMANDASTGVRASMVHVIVPSADRA